MLHRDVSIPVTLFVFDVLAVEGLPTTTQPYVRRRALLEALELPRPHVRLVGTYAARRSFAGRPALAHGIVGARTPVTRKVPRLVKNVQVVRLPPRALVSNPVLRATSVSPFNTIVCGTSTPAKPPVSVLVTNRGVKALAG
jgi:uncharacterized protein YjeT (DUF2065 family)